MIKTTTVLLEILLVVAENTGTNDITQHSQTSEIIINNIS